MMRGTIIESVPNERVDIMLPNGQSRTITMTDVVYAGPAQRRPGRGRHRSRRRHVPAAPARRRTPGARRQSASSSRPTRAALTFHRKIGTRMGTPAGGRRRPARRSMTDSLQRLCSAPCAVSCRAGRTVGLSLGGSRVLETGTEFELNGNTRLHGRVEPRAGVRVTGLVIWPPVVVGADRRGLRPPARVVTPRSICHDRYPYCPGHSCSWPVGAALGAAWRCQPDAQRGSTSASAGRGRARAAPRNRKTDGRRTIAHLSASET